MTTKTELNILRTDGSPLWSGEAASLREAVERLVRDRASLIGAYLAGANLARAYLAGAYLAGANLARAYLAGANLAGANLARAYLARANLAGANLDGATMNWNSHDLIAELLRREMGGDLGKRQLAGLVLISRDWCWDGFLITEHPELRWGLETLAAYVRDGDGAPDVLQRIARAK